METGAAPGLKAQRGGVEGEGRLPARRRHDAADARRLGLGTDPENEATRHERTRTRNVRTPNTRLYRDRRLKGTGDRGTI
jgi:hypothetical protein